MEENNQTKSIIRIAIVGPESTGKTTLTEQLATHFNTAFVPEYARSYMESLNRPYDINDIISIAKGQLLSEQTIEKTILANGLLIYDTNLLVTKIWAEFKYGYCPEWITSNLHLEKYTLHLLTKPDIVWETDPLREHPEPFFREKLFELYHTELVKMKIPFKIIEGLGNKRLENAIRAIE